MVILGCNTSPTKTNPLRFIRVDNTGFPSQPVGYLFTNPSAPKDEAVEAPKDRWQFCGQVEDSGWEAVCVSCCRRLGILW